MIKVRSIILFISFLVTLIIASCNNEDEWPIQCVLSGKVRASGSLADLEDVVVWMTNRNGDIEYYSITNSVGEFEFSFLKTASELEDPIEYDIHFSKGSYVPAQSFIIFTKDSSELAMDYSLIKEIPDERHPFCIFFDITDFYNDDVEILVTCYFSEEVMFDSNNYDEFSNATFSRIEGACTSSSFYIDEGEQETDVSNSFHISFLHNKYDVYDCDSIYYDSYTYKYDTLKITKKRVWELKDINLDSILCVDLSGNYLVNYYWSD